MDSNGLRFWMLADKADWRMESDAIRFDTTCRTLQLSRHRDVPDWPADKTAADAALAIAPQSIDRFGTRAYWSAASAAVMAADAVPGEIALFTPPAGDTVTDVALGYDDLLYVAVAGRITIIDPRERFDPENVPALLGFEAWRLAADPLGGVWALDRNSRKLAHVFGSPSTVRPHPPYGPNTVRPCQENPNPPRLVLLDKAVWPANEDAVALASSEGGALTVLFLKTGDLARVRTLSDGVFSAPKRLAGARTPFSLAHVSETQVALLMAGANESPVYGLDDPAAVLPADGDFYPLQHHDGGPFLHTTTTPPQYPSTDGPRGLYRLSLPAYTPSGAAVNNLVLDSGDPATVWHRLYVEADIPEHCGVTVYVAGVGNPDDHPTAHEWYPHEFGRSFAPNAATPRGAWMREPSEMPFHRGMLGRRLDENRCGLFTALIQRGGPAARRVRTVRGRYLKVRVELQGNGLSTPEIAAVRAYASRFSYVDKYLPELYREDTFGPEAEQIAPATPPDFFGRLVANFEGILTPLEDRIADAYLLTDADTVPPDSLEWLASWIGLSFDGAYTDTQRRQLLKATPELYSRRGTLRGLGLALDIATDGAVRRGQIVIVEDFRLRRTFATILGADLADEEDPLLGGIARSGNSFVGDTLFLGDPERKEFLALFGATLAKSASEERVVQNFFDDLANRVTILVHQEIEPQDLGLVRRVAGLETPAHVAVRVEVATNSFRAGVASLVGVDTYLAPKPKPQPARIDVSYFGGGDLIDRAPSLDPRLGGETAEALVMSFAGSPLTLVVGESGNLTLNLSGGVGPLSVSLASSATGVATVPATVNIGAGSTSVVVSVTSVAAGSATITASAADVADTTAVVHVIAPIEVGSASVGLNLSADLTITLPQAAPAGGLTVGLTSSDTNRVTVPASVNVAAGATSASVRVSGVGIGSATVTATAPGCAPGKGTVQVTAPTMSFAGSPLSLVVGQSGNLTLNLSGGAGPLTVSLGSSATGVATLPATVAFVAGATSATVSVTSAAAGSTNVTASATGIANATAVVNVVAPLDLGNVSVGLNLSANLTITLPQPAPAGGLTVTLSSGDTNRVTVPATASVSAGATSANVRVTGVGIGSAIVTATASGFAPGTGTVQVTAPTMNFAGSPLSLVVGQSGDLTLNLSGGAGPLTVSLASSATGVATVPATVAVAAGATSVAVSAAAVAAGSATVTASAAGVADATAVVNVLARIAVSAVSVGLNLAANLTITLPSPAPAGGATVTLTSSATNRVTVPPTVGVAAGATSAVVRVAGIGIGSATITATAQGFAPGTGTVQVTAPTMSFAGTPLSLVVGQSGNLTLNLSGGAGPLTINLASSATGIATVPATVSIGAGANSATVPATAVAAGSATITASAAGLANTTAVVNVLAPITVGGASVGLNLSANLAITLPSPAPAGGVNISLTSSDTSLVTVPATVSVAAGATSASVSVAGVGIGSATITAAAPGFAPGTGNVRVTAPAMSFAGSPLSLVVGQSGNLTLNLSGGAGPLTITLASSATGVATVPTTAMIGAGATSAAVPTTGVAAGSATITASAAGLANATAVVNVLSRIGVGTVSVGLNLSADLPITLPQPAPAGGVTVSLTSDTTRVTVPASVSIAAGATSATVSVTGVGIGAATITASAPGFAPGTGAVQVTAPRMTFAGSPLSLVVGQSGNLTLNLSAGAGPLTIDLASSATGVATVPATVSIGAGATGVTVPAAAVGAGSATITASAPGLANATAAVNVLAPITVGNVSVGLNLSANLPITLPQPAPAGGAVVTLRSSDTSRVTVPATVTIAAGQSSATAQATGIAIGSASITATASGFAPGNGTVRVTAPTMSFPDPTLVLSPGEVSGLTLLLSGGAGPLTVNTASAPTGIAAVAATAAVPAGQASTRVVVNATAPGSATITASAAGLNNATATVNVLAPIVVSSVAVGLGLSANLTVTLNQPASAAVVVTLSSANPAIATVPQNVTIAAGATSATALVAGVGIGSSLITASAPGFAQGSGTVRVTAPTMSFAGSPLSLVVGQSGNLTLSLAGGAGPLTVNLASDTTGIATLPASVVFAAGATSAPVAVTGTAAGSATITASAPGVANATATVNVLAQITVASISVGLNLQANLTITLPAPAPATGLTIILTSGDTAIATVPSATVVAPGTTSVTVAVVGTGIGSVRITASAPGFAPGSGTVRVTPPTMSFTNSPLGLAVGQAGVLTLNLSGGVGPLTVKVTSNATSVANVPAQVVFVQGANTVSVPVAPSGPGSATITAAAQGIANATGVVNVTAGAITVGSAGVNVGQTIDLPITLPQPAPATGVTVTLTNSDPTKLQSPPTVNIAGGGTFTAPGVKGIAQGSVTITALAPGFAPGSGTIRVVAAPALGFTGSPLTIPSGQTGRLTVTVTGAAGPLTVTLASSGPNTAIVPQSVTIAAGTAAVTFPVNAGAPGTASITASAQGMQSATAVVNVTPGVITVPPVTVLLGQSATITIPLPQPAPPPGIQAVLTSSNPGIAVVPASVTIPVGATAVAVQVRGAAVGTATVTITIAGFPNAVCIVTVAGLVIPPIITTGSPQRINPASPTEKAPAEPAQKKRAAVHKRREPKKKK